MSITTADWGVILGAVATGWSALQQYMLEGCKKKELRLQAVELELAQLKQK